MKDKDIEIETDLTEDVQNTRRKRNIGENIFEKQSQNGFGTPIFDNAAPLPHDQPLMPLGWKPVNAGHPRAAIALVVIVGIIGGIVGGWYGAVNFEEVYPKYNDDWANNAKEWIMAGGWNFFGKIGTVLMWGAMIGSIAAFGTAGLLKGHQIRRGMNL